jgi:carboxypeptidase D
VKAAIHAPDVPWQECASIEVFPEGDASPSTALSVLPSVIEKNNRTVIIHGLADYFFIAEGTRIAIQKSVIPQCHSLISSDRIYAA